MASTDNVGDHEAHAKGNSDNGTDASEQSASPDVSLRTVMRTMQATSDQENRGTNPQATSLHAVTVGNCPPLVSGLPAMTMTPPSVSNAFETQPLLMTTPVDLFQLSTLLKPAEAITASSPTRWQWLLDQLFSAPTLVGATNVIRALLKRLHGNKHSSA